MTPYPVLQFQDVAVAGGHHYDSGIWQVTFTLAAGDLMLVWLGVEQSRLPLANAAEGLLMPNEGTIRFLERDWSELSTEEACAARGQIGRVFGEPAWISGLTVDENLTLAQRHHTRRAESDIRNEAAALAKTFSLPGLPQGMASTVRRQDLQRASCVRAFLGAPRLLILEEPTAGVYPQIMPPLMASVRLARARGAAVLWTTVDQRVWNDRGISADHRCIMSGSQMRVVTGDKPGDR